MKQNSPAQIFLASSVWVCKQSGSVSACRESYFMNTSLGNADVGLTYVSVFADIGYICQGKGWEEASGRGKLIYMFWNELQFAKSSHT